MFVTVVVKLSVNPPCRKKEVEDLLCHSLNNRHDFYHVDERAFYHVDYIEVVREGVDAPFDKNILKERL
jgi:hypothetical protein